MQWITPEWQVSEWLYKKIFAEKHINKIGLKSIDFYKSFVITQVMSVLYSSFLYVISTKMDLNKVMLIGRATNNLQVKSIESSGTPVANFTVATNRKFKNRDGNLLEDAEYHRCVAYGKWAEVLWKYLTKWKRVYIEWRLRTRKWQDSEWNERFSTEVIVDNFIFLDSKWQPWEDTWFASDVEHPIPDDEEVPF